ARPISKSSSVFGLFFLSMNSSLLRGQNYILFCIPPNLIVLIFLHNHRTPSLKRGLQRYGKKYPPAKLLA
ncbi:MAG: hypothetical protein J6J76_00750, partial [Paraprevotella sp.]|nr:hypothetical protein [Flavobacteriales bacterium]MBP3566071.1 hypothetical protein [Paraprevotella sp.]